MRFLIRTVPTSDHAQRTHDTLEASRDGSSSYSLKDVAGGLDRNIAGIGALLDDLCPEQRLLPHGIPLCMTVAYFSIL